MRLQEVAVPEIKPTLKVANCSCRVSIFLYIYSNLEAELRFSLFNYKEFRYIFRNLQKSFHTFPRCSGPNNWGYRSFFPLSNGILILKGAETKLLRFCKLIYHCWVGRMNDTHYFSGRSISERFENSFVNYGIYYSFMNYGIYYGKLCD